MLFLHVIGHTGRYNVFIRYSHSQQIVSTDEEKETGCCIIEQFQTQGLNAWKRNSFIHFAYVLHSLMENVLEDIGWLTGQTRQGAERHKYEV